MNVKECTMLVKLLVILVILCALVGLFSLGMNAVLTLSQMFAPILSDGLENEDLSQDCKDLQAYQFLMRLISTTTDTLDGGATRTLMQEVENNLKKDCGK